MNHSRVYLFKADGAVFTSAVFSSFKIAQTWICENSLSGLLTEYPVNISTYDWAIKKGYFKVKNVIDISPVFMGSFVSAYQAQWHFKHGKIDHQFSRNALRNFHIL